MSRQAPILLTGFEGFGDFPINSSWEGVRRLDGKRIDGVAIVARRLPVAFRKIKPALLAVLDETRPRAVVAFGLAAAPAVSIERLARNRAHVKSSSIGDNEGCRPDDEPLIAGGQEFYRSTLPIRAIDGAVARALKSLRSGIAPRISHSAGTFLCNAAFYYLAEWASRNPSRPPVGFIHVPPLRTGRSKTFTRPQLHRVVRAVVEAVINGPAA